MFGRAVILPVMSSRARCAGSLAAAAVVAVLGCQSRGGLSIRDAAAVEAPAGSTIVAPDGAAAEASVVAPVQPAPPPVDAPVELGSTPVDAPVGVAGSGVDPDGGPRPPPTFGACVVHDFTVPLPLGTQQNGGSWGRILVMPGVTDVATLRQVCTQALLEDMLHTYCLAGNLEEVRFEVVTYEQDGTMHEWACASDECVVRGCGTGASCTIRSDSTPLPVWSAPDVGYAYVRRRFPGFSAFTTLSYFCTPDVFAQVLTQYCALYGQSGAEVKLELDLYHPDWGDWSAETCASDGRGGCASAACP